MGLSTSGGIRQDDIPYLRSAPDREPPGISRRVFGRQVFRGCGLGTSVFFGFSVPPVTV